MAYLNKFAAVGLTASLTFFAACGAKEQSTADAAQEVVIPDAPDAAITTIIQEVSQGNGGILWQAMPASYQTDVTEVVQLAGTKVDGEVYGKVASVLTRLGGIAKDKQDFIFNTSLGSEPLPAEEKAKLQEAWPSVVSLFEVTTGSQLASVEGLQAFDGQEFFGVTVSEILKHVDALAKLSDDGSNSISDLAQVVVSLVESSDSEATLQFALPDESEETQSFTKVDGKWLPTDLVAEWSTQIADAKSTLEALTPEKIAESKTQTMMMVGMVEGILTQLEGAQTQEQFDAALQGAMMPIMMMGMQMSGGLNGAPAGAAPQMPAASSAPVSQ